MVEDSVNRVGVDLNTASVPLDGAYFRHFQGNCEEYRSVPGRKTEFRNRKELLKVAKLGPKAFEQCAGFMRISGGDNPLDATSIHPESYEAAGSFWRSLATVKAGQASPVQRQFM